MERQLFEQMYDEGAPWDISGPQPAFVQLAESGEIQGSVLDVGCGTGENVLYLAAQGYEASGIDYVPVAIERAKAKAAQQKSTAQFQVGDALKLADLGRQFDTVIDSGLFHTFSDEERPTFVAGLHHILRPDGRLHILCFSDEEPGTDGPRRVSQQEIRDAFKHGWKIERIAPARFKTVEDLKAFGSALVDPRRGWQAFGGNDRFNQMRQCCGILISTP